MMERLGVDHVDKVLLPARSASYIDSRHAMVLGMIPDADLDKVFTVGNSAGDGARIALLNRAQREEARRLARWVDYVAVALEPRFQMRCGGGCRCPISTTPSRVWRNCSMLPRRDARRAVWPMWVSARERRLLRVARRAANSIWRMANSVLRMANNRRVVHTP